MTSKRRKGNQPLDYELQPLPAPICDMAFIRSTFFPFFGPKDFIAFALAGKSMLKEVNAYGIVGNNDEDFVYEPALRSIILHHNSHGFMNYRSIVPDIMEMVCDSQVFLPTPLRLYRLATATRCELHSNRHIHSTSRGTPNGRCSKFGLFLCARCEHDISSPISTAFGAAGIGQRRNGLKRIVEHDLRVCTTSSFQICSVDVFDASGQRKGPVFTVESVRAECKGFRAIRSDHEVMDNVFAINSELIPFDDINSAVHSATSAASRRNKEFWRVEDEKREKRDSIRTMRTEKIRKLIVDEISAPWAETVCTLSNAAFQKVAGRVMRAPSSFRKKNLKIYATELNGIFRQFPFEYFDNSSMHGFQFLRQDCIFHGTKVRQAVFNYFTRPIAEHEPDSLTEYKFVKRQHWRENAGYVQRVRVVYNRTEMILSTQEMNQSNCINRTAGLRFFEHVNAAKSNKEIEKALMYELWKSSGHMNMKDVFVVDCINSDEGNRFRRTVLANFARLCWSLNVSYVHFGSILYCSPSLYPYFVDSYDRAKRYFDRLMRNLNEYTRISEWGSATEIAICHLLTSTRGPSFRSFLSEPEGNWNAPLVKGLSEIFTQSDFSRTDTFTLKDRTNPMFTSDYLRLLFQGNYSSLFEWESQRLHRAQPWL